MRDRIIFIISVILVVVGLSYLGYTAYRFFTANRGEVSEQLDEAREEMQPELSLQSPSNLQVINRELQEGESVEVKAELKNNTNTRIQKTFEGRVYQVDQVNTFPNIDTDVPLVSEDINVSVEGGETATVTYDYTARDAGNYYIAIADKDYWNTGRGVISYGYFIVPEQVVQAPDQPAPAGDIGQVAGRQDQSTTPAQPKETVKELPKAGATENMIALGMILAGLGLFYNRRLASEI